MDNKIDMPNKIATSFWMRWALVLFGWLNVVIGLIGVVVPGLPTTIFLIVAFWAFSRSSVRLQKWIWTHPRFGSTVRHWHNYRVIPRKAKILAVLMMLFSFVYLTVFVAESMVIPIVMALIMIPSAIYVVTRADMPPENTMSEIASRS